MKIHETRGVQNLLIVEVPGVLLSRVFRSVNVTV